MRKPSKMGVSNPNGLVLTAKLSFTKERPSN